MAKQISKHNARKVSTAKLIHVLDALVVTPQWTKAMGSIRMSEASAWVWGTASAKAEKDNDRSSPYFLEWHGAFDYWHRHASRARSFSIVTYEHLIRDQAMNGIQTPVLGPDQKPIYMDDPELLDVSDEDLWNLFGRRHRYLLDEKGRPVPLMKREQLPAPLRLAVLRQDPRYIEQTNVSVNQNVTITAKPVSRPEGEARPDIERLRALALMSPEARRKALDAAAFPQDANGAIAPTNKIGSIPNAPEPPRAAQSPAPPKSPYARPPVHASGDHTEKLGAGEDPQNFRGHAGMKMV